MILRTLSRLTVGALAVLALFAAGRPANAQVTITGTFTPGFSYSLFVNYQNATDPLDTLALVTINVPTGVTGATNLTPPPGFIMVFDQAFGLLDLAEDNDPLTPQTFAAGTTQGPFVFSSPVNLNGATFTALDSTNQYEGTLRLTQTAAPEPASLALLGVAAAGLLALRRSTGKSHRLSGRG